VDLDSYLPILLFLIVGALIGIAPVLIGMMLGPNRPDPEKLSPYECGFEAFEDARMKSNVLVLPVAILFILFDLESRFPVSLGSDIGRPGSVERRLLGHDVVSGHFDGRLRVRVEKGRVGLGMITARFRP